MGEPRGNPPNSGHRGPEPTYLDPRRIMNREQTRAPGNGACPDPDDARPPDPLRRVVAGFCDARALVRARREVVAEGCEESRIEVVAPPDGRTNRFGLLRRLRERLTERDGSRAGIIRQCLELLRREFALVFVDARSIPHRSSLETTFAEHGAVILGADGTFYPDPDTAAPDAPANDVARRNERRIAGRG